ncbi:PREDICTED: uncharacterized protein LOC104816435 [Tarenaya hassleriana]|uniref:uncharacterized protein LOC104816435 n=1 Tax=Tarenaya hassleriana TaxID=28532 RepID=UPI00053C58D0|nr:PREDICTED: uncharacterized protein LOC104816435 [Tarenaya hassleriana]
MGGMAFRWMILVIVAASVIELNDAKEVPFSTENTVVVKNLLSINKNLKVHCRSKDNDLGVRILTSLHNSYEFHFADNIIGTTLFWCNVWQGRNYEHHQVFEAYKAKWYNRYNQLYKWEARDDGVYFGHNEQVPVFKYAWDVPHK